MVFPAFQNNAILYGPQLASMQTQIITTSSVQIANNASGPTDDQELQFYTVPNAGYIVEVYALFLTAVDSDGGVANFGDVRVDWLVPLGSSAARMSYGATDNEATWLSRTDTRMNVAGKATADADRTYTLTSAAAGAQTLSQAVWEKGTVTCGSIAGRFVFRWAQGFPTAGDLTRDVNSFMRVTRYA
jgi:hypothetical protein